MSTYRLTYLEGDKSREFAFDSGEVVIGRSPDCQVVLKDFGISRNHAKIVVDEDGARLVDLNSKNGTQVNGQSVRDAPLRDGDHILVGKLLLTFAKAIENRVVLDAAKPLSEEAGTIIRSVGELSRIFSGADSAGGGRPGELRPGQPRAPVPETSDVQAIARSNRILQVLNGFARELLTVRPLEDVLAQIMDLVFEHVPADRGFLMLQDEAAPEQLVPRVVKYRQDTQAEGRITVSKTIADMVMRQRVAILTSDAQIDSRFGAGDSIRFHGIRSAMCAPLWNQDASIGIIHVDSPMLVNCFGGDDLDLLTALANFAAMAIERSRLNQKIVEEERKRERLGRFLSPQVTTRILAAAHDGSQALGAPEVREVSVLFADIVGFTSLSERLSPASVALLLNDYLSRMTEVIFKYEGTLDKYIGDAIMAVFGAPLDMPDHARRAVQAALEMRERLEEFNAERRDTPPIEVRIGINTGKAVAGEIGSVNKKEYTVLGDTVNTASRLESGVARPGTIVVGENTYAAVRETFECHSLGRLSLKGKQHEVEVFEVESARGGTPPAGVTPRGGLQP